MSGGGGDTEVSGFGKEWAQLEIIGLLSCHLILAHAHYCSLVLKILLVVLYTESFIYRDIL